MASTFATEATLGPVRRTEDRYTVIAFKMNVATALNGEQGPTCPFPAHTAVTGTYTLARRLYRNADCAAKAPSPSLGFAYHIFLLKLHSKIVNERDN